MSSVEKEDEMLLQSYADEEEEDERSLLCAKCEEVRKDLKVGTTIIIFVVLFELFFGILGWICWNLELLIWNILFLSFFLSIFSRLIYLLIESVKIL